MPKYRIHMQTQQNLLDQKKREATLKKQNIKKSFYASWSWTHTKNVEYFLHTRWMIKKMRNTAPTNENNETVTIRKTRLLNHLIISINHKLHDKKNTMTYFIHYAKHENTLRLCWWCAPLYTLHFIRSFFMAFKKLCSRFIEVTSVQNILAYHDLVFGILLLVISICTLTIRGKEDNKTMFMGIRTKLVE